MDRLHSLEAFVRVAESGSFIEAARQLGVARSVVTHRVKQLERFIGAPVFHRSTRNVRLSEVGEAHVEQATEILRSIDAFFEGMGALSKLPRGKMRIRIAPGFAIDYFGFLLADFMEQYPDIDMDVVMDDKVADPITEGFDVVLQLFPPNGDTLVERRLFPVQRLFCAAPAYLESNASILKPSDLLQHSLALYDGYPSRYRFQFQREDEVVDIVLPGKLRSSSVHLLRDFTINGGGIACLPTLVVSQDLQTGRLLPVLPRYRLSPLIFRAVYPVTERRPGKVRALIEFLEQRVPAEPPWDVPLLERGWLKPAVLPAVRS